MNDFQQADEFFNKVNDIESKATPLPWKWSEIEDRTFQLEGNIEYSEMCPVLLPYRCENCRKRGAPCMSPNDADKEAIVFYRNYGPRLAKALNYAMKQLSGSKGALDEIMMKLNGDD